MTDFILYVRPWSLGVEDIANLLKLFSSYGRESESYPLLVWLISATGYLKSPPSVLRFTFTLVSYVMAYSPLQETAGLKGWGLLVSKSVKAGRLPLVFKKGCMPVFFIKEPYIPG